MVASTVQGEEVEVSSEMIEAGFAEFRLRFPDCGGYSEASKISSAVLWERRFIEAFQLSDHILKRHDMALKVCLLKRRLGFTPAAKFFGKASFDMDLKTYFWIHSLR
jgi:hypothetical protein